MGTEAKACRLGSVPQAQSRLDEGHAMEELRRAAERLRFNLGQRRGGLISVANFTIRRPTAAGDVRRRIGTLFSRGRRSPV